MGVACRLGGKEIEETQRIPPGSKAKEKTADDFAINDLITGPERFVSGANASLEDRFIRIEGTPRGEFDLSAQGFGVHLRQVGVEHGNLAHQSGWDLVKRDMPSGRIG